MVYQDVKLMYDSRMPEHLMMTAPDYSWEEIIQFASNRDAWRQLVTAVKDYSNIVCTLT